MFNSIGIGYIHWSLPFVKTPHLFEFLLIVNTIILVGFTILLILKANNYKPYFSYIGFGVGVCLTTIVLLVSLINGIIRKDGFGSIYPFFYTLDQIFVLILICNIPTILLLVITVVANWKYRTL